MHRRYLAHSNVYGDRDLGKVVESNRTGGADESDEERDAPGGRLSQFRYLAAVAGVHDGQMEVGVARVGLFEPAAGGEDVVDDVNSTVGLPSSSLLLGSQSVKWYYQSLGIENVMLHSK